MYMDLTYYIATGYYERKMDYCSKHYVVTFLSMILVVNVVNI